MIIRPCPFCGEPKDIDVGCGTPDREGTPTWLYCGNCGANGPWAYCKNNDVGEPTKEWNVRTTDNVFVGKEIDLLRGELASWQEAFGLLTTLHGSMQIDSSDPMRMAKQIEAQVLPQLAELRKPDCFRCAYWFACRTLIKDDCGGGDKFVPKRDPVRLYEKE